MTGVDPSAAMLAVARCGQHGDRVQWIYGDTTAVPALAADLALMSGHVAQFFVTDDAWAAALTALHTALRPGGTLAFESRNPDNREWERWTRAGARTANDPSSGRAHRDVVGGRRHQRRHRLLREPLRLPRRAKTSCRPPGCVSARFRS